MIAVNSWDSHFVGLVNALRTLFIGESTQLDTLLSNGLEECMGDSLPGRDID